MQERTQWSHLKTNFDIKSNKAFSVVQMVTSISMWNIVSSLLGNKQIRAPSRLWIVYILELVCTIQIIQSTLSYPLEEHTWSLPICVFVRYLKFHSQHHNSNVKKFWLLQSNYQYQGVGFNCEANICSRISVSWKTEIHVHN